MLLIRNIFKKIYKVFSHFINGFSRFSRAVIFLGIVSGLMNLSTAIISSTAVDFFSNIGSTSFLIGIRSFSEGAGYLIKVAIGVMSDMTKQRKLFLLIGYGGVLFIKPLFILVSLSFLPNYLKAMIYGIAHSSDRILNAARDPARDSLIADWSNKEDRLSAFGFRKFCSSLGSIIGGILVIICLNFTKKYSIIYTLATIPAFLSVFILYHYVQDNHHDNDNSQGSWFSIKDLFKHKQQLINYSLFMLVIFILNFGKLNEVCLWKIGTDIGYTNYSSYFYILFYTVIALSSYYLSHCNITNNFTVVILCNLSLFLGNLIISYSQSLWSLMIGIILYGIYNGITESVIAGIIVTLFPQKNMRATLFGIMNTVLGISIFTSFFLVNYLLKITSLSNVYYISTIPPIISSVLFLLIYRKNLF